MTERSDAEFEAAAARVAAANEAYPELSLGNFMKNWEKARDKLIEAHGKDFDKPVMSFNLNKAEMRTINAWLESLKPEILAIQRKNGNTMIHEIVGNDEPYYGATGGGVTYSFIPTSLGTIITVKETITGKELNVSDACDWYFYG